MAISLFFTSDLNYDESKLSSKIEKLIQVENFENKSQSTLVDCISCLSRNNKQCQTLVTNSTFQPFDMYLSNCNIFD